ncbi:MAG: DUF3267 domain-containing protein [Ktedonobacteraceae bacterium]|nr:DUF3267 domain-containing protein [Ktedonobacteraceae bacterium]
MRSVTSLPEEFEEWSTIDLKRDKSLMIVLSILSIVVFLGTGWLFFMLANWLAPAFVSNSTQTFGPLEILIGLLVVSVVMLVGHEAIHGLFFWIFTGNRPVFGFHWVYAYAAAPGWYIPRVPFIIIGLAPLVLITLLGLLLLPFVSSVLVALTFVLAMTLNAGGAVGDLYVVCWLLGKRGPLLIRDYGDGMTVYGVQRNQLAKG